MSRQINLVAEGSAGITNHCRMWPVRTDEWENIKFSFQWESETSKDLKTKFKKKKQFPEILEMFKQRSTLLTMQRSKRLLSFMTVKPESTD